MSRLRCWSYAVYEQLDNGTPPAQALTVAQNWLRTATVADLTSAYPDLFAAARSAGPAIAAGRGAHIPYGNPAHWAAFTYTGI